MVLSFDECARFSITETKNYVLLLFKNGNTILILWFVLGEKRGRKPRRESLPRGVERVNGWGETREEGGGSRRRPVPFNVHNILWNIHPALHPLLNIGGRQKKGNGREKVVGAEEERKRSSGNEALTGSSQASRDLATNTAQPNEENSFHPKLFSIHQINYWVAVTMRVMTSRCEPPLLPHASPHGSGRCEWERRRSSQL